MDTEANILELWRSRIVEKMDYHHVLSDEDIQKQIDNLLMEESRKQYLSLKKREKYRKWLFDSIRRYDILSEALDDPEVSEIMVNGPQQIFVERKGKIEPVKHVFSDENRLLDLIQHIVSEINREVNESFPIADARLPDGSRVNIVLPPAAVDGPVMTIRKFKKQFLSMANLLENHTLSEELAAYLIRCVQERKNIFISGGTGAGKTTLINILSSYIPPEERVIVIEDLAELQLQNTPHLIRLEARQGNRENGIQEITIRTLLKTALRMRPDRIIIGEVRGNETLDLLQALNTGHSGSMSTGHSNGPKDMLSRLETLSIMAMDMPLQAVRRQIVAALDVLVHIRRTPEGRRQVSSVMEMRGIKGGEYDVDTVYSDG